MRKFTVKFISSTVAAVLLLCASSVNMFAASEETVTVADTAYNASSDYSDYLSKSEITESADTALSLDITSFSADSAQVSTEDGRLIWQNGSGSVKFSFNVEKAGLYNLKLVWNSLGAGADPDFGIKINGEYLFEGLEKVTVHQMWENATEEPRTDDQGNEYAQEQVIPDEFNETLIQDDTGAVAEPYLFALSAGTNTLELISPDQSIAISAVEFVPPEQTVSYKELSATYDIKNIDADVIEIEGEDAALKSDSSIIPKSNNSDAGMSPSDPNKFKINYIGGGSWSKPTQKIIWNFEVKQAGYYYFNMRYKQSELANDDSLRWLKIDGKTPFEEAKSLTFPYGSGWNYYTLGESEDAPYYLWLDKGPHTLSLEVTPGGKSEYFARLYDIVQTLGDEYIKIVMITSETPDANRSYELFNQIPDFNKTLSSCKDSLLRLAEDMKSASGKNSTQAIAAMENMARVLNSMIKSPYMAHQYVKDYYNNYTSLSSWLYDMLSMPLAVDKIQFIPAGKNAENNKTGFFKSVSFGVLNLLASFTTNYNFSSDESESIVLWVNWGQDQASALNSLIEDSFTPETGIKVQIKITNASLINGILSGNFPDLALNMTRTDPVNLGIRGALCDLTEFEDCEQILERFQDGAEIPYKYNDALYALPDTQTFFLMFYRTDIFEKLGLGVPSTWDEFLYAATVIQRNNMGVYVPYTQITQTTTVNSGIGILNLLPTLMWQNGLSLYNDELTATALTSKKAVDTFEAWTDFYTKYDFYKESDFYNRFRVGAMPLGIAPYTTYMTFYSAAPEIKDRWSVALVPGNGDNRYVAGGGTGCAIIKKSDKKEAAWEFLKWWTSETTQSRYSKNAESLLGRIGRIAVSNKNALSSLAWDPHDLSVITEQRSFVKEVPEVPGGYYLTRAVDQAYWAVLNDDDSPKDALNKWSKVADDEIKRKIEEYK